MKTKKQNHKRNHNTKSLKKLYLDLHKKILTAGFLIIFVAVILMLGKKETTSDVLFVWDQGDTQQIHGAADNSQWDYLFQDSNQTSGTIDQNTNTSSQTNGSLDNLVDQNEVQQVLTQNSNQSGQKIYSGTFGSDLSNYINQQLEKQLGYIPKDCMTPRGEVVKHKDFVLAYQQRSDVNTICNVQRRICNDGILGGNYTQSSCREDITYNYTKAEVISYNEQKIDPLVQPTEASNVGANFSNQGKINQTTQSLDSRTDKNGLIIVNRPSIPQNENIEHNCQTPRGTVVNQGQFVKAYKSSLGFTDLPCDVELRLCVNGNLRGTYVNKLCKVKDMTSNDYLVGNRDNSKPTPQDITNTLEADVNLFDNASTSTTTNSIRDRVLRLLK